MQIESDTSPRKSGAMSEYRQAVKAVLDQLAEWQPRPGHCCSETAMTIAATREAGDYKANRDVIHATFEVLQDRGYVVRESGVWRFTFPFRQNHADELSNWNGFWMPGPDFCNDKNETSWKRRGR